MRLISPLVLFFIVGYCGFATAQVLRPENSKGSKILDSLPFIELSASGSIQQSELETRRASSYDFPKMPPLAEKNTSPGAKAGSTYFRQETILPALPVSASDTIVIGHLESLVPHLSKSGNFVYSIFKFSPESYLKNKKNFPLSSVTLERAGGIIRRPSGEKELIGFTGQGLPVPGHRYLFFLRTSPDGLTLKILTGYDLSNEGVVALDFSGTAASKRPQQDLLRDLQAEVARENAAK